MSIEIIAEIANAHQGNYKEALKLGLAAYGSNADAIKYQIYFAEEFLSKDHQDINILKTIIHQKTMVPNKKLKEQQNNKKNIR